MKKILVVAVHPDDETLGCGGALLRHKKNGDQIFWCIATTITTALGFTKKQIEQREAEIVKVSEAYGFNDIKRFHFLATRLDTIPMGDLVQSFSKVITELSPDTIYLPFQGDVHSDHRIAFQAAYSCTKSFRYPCIKRILMMETLSETEFAPPTCPEMFFPNVFIDISPFIKEKINIMELYASEIAPPPFPRSLHNIEALANIRGATAGCHFAESFMLLREIV